VTAGPVAGPRDARTGAALALLGVRKRWGPKQVLDDVSLELRPGELAWLGGRNGAGKTTLLRIACGLIVPDAGEVTLHGLHPERDRRAYQGRLGVLSAGNLGLYARLTVTDNLDFFAALALVPPSKRPATIELAIARFDLGDLTRSRTDRLSTGQRQRVRLASVFLHDPDVVLLDEPHTSLDDESLALLRSVLEDLTARGGTALWCSPTPRQAAVGYDRGFRVEDGRIVPS
jgi:ABC-type multidrug transport system ATPase subunit